MAILRKSHVLVVAFLVFIGWLVFYSGLLGSYHISINIVHEGRSSSMLHADGKGPQGQEATDHPVEKHDLESNKAYARESIPQRQEEEEEAGRGSIHPISTKRDSKAAPINHGFDNLDESLDLNDYYYVQLIVVDLTCWCPVLSC